MPKTKEELQKLKQELIDLTNKFNELTEDELREIIGAKNEFVIKPGEDTMWESFNPNAYLDPKHFIK